MTDALTDLGSDCFFECQLFRGDSITTAAAARAHYEARRQEKVKQRGHNEKNGADMFGNKRKLFANVVGASDALALEHCYTFCCPATRRGGSGKRVMPATEQ
jgi:hypothetical protein